MKIIKNLDIKKNLFEMIPATFIIGSDKLNWNVYSKNHFKAFLNNKIIVEMESVVGNFSRVLAFALKMSQQFYYSPIIIDTVHKIFRGERIKKICNLFEIGAIVKCRKSVLPTLYSRINYVKKNWLLNKNIKNQDYYNNYTYIKIKNSINLVILLNTDKCKYIIRDAIKFGVPFIAIIGGDNNTSRITYPIPGNGRDIRTAIFFVELIAEAKVQGEKDRMAIEAKMLKI